MIFRAKGVVSIFDIENARVRFAQLEIDESPETLACAVGLFRKRYVRPGLAKVIRAIDSAHRVQGSHVILNMPRHQVTARRYKLPSLNPLR